MNIKNMGSLLIIVALLACLASFAEAKEYYLEADFGNSATLIVDGNSVKGDIHAPAHCGEWLNGDPSQILCVAGLEIDFSGSKNGGSFEGRRLPCEETSIGDCAYEGRPEQIKGTITFAYDGNLHMIVEPGGKFTFSIDEDPFAG